MRAFVSMAARGLFQDGFRKRTKKTSMPCTMAIIAREHARVVLSWPWRIETRLEAIGLKLIGLRDQDGHCSTILTHPDPKTRRDAPAWRNACVWLGVCL
jgi:hypothetical protein